MYELVVCTYVSTCTLVYPRTAIPGHMTEKNLVVRGNFSPTPTPSFSNVCNACNALSYAYPQLHLVYVLVLTLPSRVISNKQCYVNYVFTHTTCMIGIVYRTI